MQQLTIIVNNCQLVNVVVTSLKFFKFRHLRNFWNLFGSKMQLPSVLQCNVECTILHLHKLDAISLKYFKGFVWEKVPRVKGVLRGVQKGGQGAGVKNWKKARNELQRNVEMDTPPIVISSCCEKTSKGQWQRRKDPKNNYICQSFLPTPLLPSTFAWILNRWVWNRFLHLVPFKTRFGHSQRIKQKKHGFKKWN